MLYAEALRSLQEGEPAAAEDLQRWIDSGDLLTWSVVFALLERPSTSYPAGDAADFMRRYLLRCIEENPPSGDYLHGGYEAAWELARLLKKWGGRPIRGIVVDLERLYRRGDPATKNRVLCGVLEHAFEDPSLRKAFASWERDEELRDAYRLATEWGESHQQ